MIGCKNLECKAKHKCARFINCTQDGEFEPRLGDYKCDWFISYTQPDIADKSQQYRQVSERKTGTNHPSGLIDSGKLLDGLKGQQNRI